MLAELEDALDAELRDLTQRDRLRTLPPLGGASRIRATLADRAVLSFSSNDYLGLASHPALATAAADATAIHGFGAAASRLVAGDLPPHRALEASLARYLGHPAVLLFPTGYQANLGAITALANRDDLIVSDALNHASLIDGCRLSRASIQIYPHLDATAANALLASPHAAQFRRRFLVTESVFSMDGDVAPLADLAEIAAATKTCFLVDEAHAVGALGPRGRGLSAQLGITPDVTVATLGKAFGAAGGFVAGIPALRATLENRARTFLFTTAAPPSLPAAAAAALAIIDSAQGDALRQSLATAIAHFHHSRAALTEKPSLLSPLSPPPASALQTPIAPIILGADAAALAASRALLADGIFVQAIRPPTVAEGTARLRVTFSAAHTPADVDRLLAACARHAL